MVEATTQPSCIDYFEFAKSTAKLSLPAEGKLLNYHIA